MGSYDGQFKNVTIMYTVINSSTLLKDCSMYKLSISDNFDFNH